MSIKQRTQFCSPSQVKPTHLHWFYQYHIRPAYYIKLIIASRRLNQCHTSLYRCPGSGFGRCYVLGWLAGATSRTPKPLPVGGSVFQAVATKAQRTPPGDVSNLAEPRELQRSWMIQVSGPSMTFMDHVSTPSLSTSFHLFPPKILLQSMPSSIWQLSIQLSNRQFLCPISMDIMLDPVVVGGSGNTYDRKSIEKHFQHCYLASNLGLQSFGCLFFNRFQSMLLNHVQWLLQLCLPSDHSEWLDATLHVVPADSHPAGHMLQEKHDLYDGRKHECCRRTPSWIRLELHCMITINIH